jgi:hypothetical protein
MLAFDVLFLDGEDLQTFRFMVTKRSAAARPMPDAPPVTTATFEGEKAEWIIYCSPSSKLDSY